MNFGSTMTFSNALRRLALSLPLFVSPALAQISGGAFRGEIHDESRAVMPRVKIAIRSSATGLEVVAESNTEGLYLTPNLTPGSYLLRATKAGFKAEVFGPVTLDVN